MKYALVVCLIALAAGSFAPSTAAQAPALQQGITVELVNTHNASPVPQADSEDAFIIAVTENGSVYLGANLITLSELTEKARGTPFRRGQAIYIKADARSRYASVLPVLEATAGVIPQVLLTSQSASPESNGIVPPEGLNVSVGSTFPPGTLATVVQLRPSVQGKPRLRVNNDETSWSALESTLRRHFQKGDEKSVLLRADTRLPFAEVVQAIDACHAAGATIHMARPGI